MTGARLVTSQTIRCLGHFPDGSLLLVLDTVVGGTYSLELRSKSKVIGVCYSVSVIALALYPMRTVFCEYRVLWGRCSVALVLYE